MNLILSYSIECKSTKIIKSEREIMEGGEREGGRERERRIGRGGEGERE